jgi:hypothetical protein
MREAQRIPMLAAIAVTALRVTLAAWLSAGWLKPLLLSAVFVSAIYLVRLWPITLFVGLIFGMAVWVSFDMLRDRHKGSRGSPGSS